jgi:hypothetical protein
MYSSGQATVGTSGAGNVTLIAVPAGGFFNYLRIVNEGTQPGSFSPDNGSTWGRIPAATLPYAGGSPVPAVVEAFGNFNQNVLIKRATSTDMSGVSGHATEYRG